MMMQKDIDNSTDANVELNYQDDEVLNKPHPSEDLVGALTIIRDVFCPEVRRVYYPCCGLDTSPFEVFGDSVLFLDKDKNIVSALRKANLNARRSSALSYRPGEVDILILLNPQISPHFPCSFVRAGGFVVCNNYHQTADKVYELPDFENVGLVKRFTNPPQLIQEDLHNCFIEVDTEEEFRNAPFSFNYTSLDCVQKAIDKLYPGATDYLAKTKSLIERAEREDPSDDVIHTLWIGDVPLTITKCLPRKLSVSDDTFVFRRKKA